MVYKSANHEKVMSIRFLLYHDFFFAEFALFSVAILSKLKARVALQIGSFSWSILSPTIALNQSARENSDTIVKRLISLAIYGPEWVRL